MARRSSSSTARASSSRSTTAWLSEPSGDRRAGVAHRPGRADAVGEVALGGRAHADVRPGGAQQPDVVAGHPGRVHGRRPRAEHPVVVQHPGRRRAVRLQARVVLRRLLRDVHVQRCCRPTSRRPWRSWSARHRPHRVRSGADHDVVGAGRPSRSAVARAAQPSASPSPKRDCTPSSGCTDATGEVAGVQQRDADAGVAGRLDQRQPHRVRVVVRRAARCVVQVVELADAGDSRERHLGEDRPGQPAVGVRVEPRRRRRTSARRHVQKEPPGSPPDPARRLRAAAQRPVEGVRVRVGQAGEHQPAKPLTGRRRVLGDRA